VSHQFHQYQQNEQSPLIFTELTEHKKLHRYWSELLSWPCSCHDIAEWALNSNHSLKIATTVVHVYKGTNLKLFFSEISIIW